MHCSTTSEAQPPQEDGPFPFVFNHDIFRRRRPAMDPLNGMPLGTLRFGRLD